MCDTCELRQPDVLVLDENTGQYVKSPGPLIATTRCKIQSKQVTAPEAGDRLVVVARLEAHIPMSVAEVAPDDLVTVTVSTNDPQLQGRRFRIVSQVHESYMTARRLVVEEHQT